MTNFGQNPLQRILLTKTWCEFHVDRQIVNTGCTYVQQNSFNLTKMGPQVQGLSNGSNTDLSYTQFFVTSQSATRECAPISYFHFIIKKLSFFNYHMRSHTFSFRIHFYKPLYTTPCPNAGVSAFWSISIKSRGILTHMAGFSD